MSVYQRVIIFLLFSISCLFSSEYVYKNVESKEDLYILYALEHEKNSSFEKARVLYLKLYNLNRKPEYLIKYLRTSLFLKKFKDVNKIASKNLKINGKYNELTLRIYCISLLNTNKSSKAFNIATILLKNFDKSINYELMANVYFVKKDYQKSVDYYESAFAMNKEANTLFNLVNVLYIYLDQKKQALAYLETYVVENGCDLLVCTKLLSIYEEEKNIDGAISILTRLYSQYKTNKENNNFHKIYKLLISYLEKKDINLAIKFLEKNDEDRFELISLYKRTNQSKKALQLVRKIYKQTGDLHWLAQIAIIEFESTYKKEDILNSVIKKLETVLSKHESHLYQNYLAYILIDYDLDVQRGLDLANKALQKSPDNIAYLDSKAWALYKLDRCSEAYDIMQKVIDKIGFRDKEIILHWKTIKECKLK